MDPVSEVGKTGRSFIEALRKEWPLSLALCVMNIGLLLFFWLILTKVSDQREREIALLYSDKQRVEDMLSKCIIPERRSDISETIPLPIPFPGVKEP